MNFETYKGGSHQWTDASAWSNGVAPISGWSVDIGSGTVTADGLTLSNDVINIEDSNGKQRTTVNFNNTTLDTGTQLGFLTGSASTLPTVNLTGQDENDGVISNANMEVREILTNNGTVNGNTTIVFPSSLSSLFDNPGLVDAETAATISIGRFFSAGAFINSGTIEDKGTVSILSQTTQTGNGVTNIDGGVLDLNAAFQGGVINISLGTLEFGPEYQSGVSTNPDRHHHLQPYRRPIFRERIPG